MFKKSLDKYQMVIKELRSLNKKINKDLIIEAINQIG